MLHLFDVIHDTKRKYATGVSNRSLHTGLSIITCRPAWNQYFLAQSQRSFKKRKDYIGKKCGLLSLLIYLFGELLFCWTYHNLMEYIIRACITIHRERRPTNKRNGGDLVLLKKAQKPTLSENSWTVRDIPLLGPGFPQNPKMWGGIRCNRR